RSTATWPRTASIRGSGQEKRAGIGRDRVTVSPSAHVRDSWSLPPRTEASALSPFTCTEAPSHQAGTRSASVHWPAPAATRIPTSPSAGYSVVISSSTSRSATAARTVPVTYWWSASSSPLVVATYAGSDARVRAMFVGQQETVNHGARWLELARGVGSS